MIEVDVRGQTCPGYLPSIHRAVQGLASGTQVRIRSSYPPCADDVRAWCAARGHRLESVTAAAGEWVLLIRLS